MYRLSLILIFAAALMPSVSGCRSTPKVHDDPVAAMLRSGMSAEDRWDAIHQAEQENRDTRRLFAAYGKLVWEKGYPAEFSNHAVDLMIALDEAKAMAYFDQTLLRIEDWETVTHICQTAADHQWTAFIPTLIRSYARPTPALPDAQRPERHAIEKLVPDQPVEQTLYAVFADDGAQINLVEQAAAWELLMRLVPDPTLRIAILEKNPPSGPPNALVQSLRATTKELHILPERLETIAWSHALDAEHTSFRKRCTDLIVTLDPSACEGLALRHLPALIEAADHHPQWLHENRAAQLQAIDRLLADQEHHLTGPSFDGPMTDYPQNFAHWKSKLSWGDALTLRVLMPIVRDPRYRRFWFDLAKADRDNIQTEYGGLIRRTTGASAAPLAYPPAMYRGDLRYVPPKQLIPDAYTAMAHFHFMLTPNTTGAMRDRAWGIRNSPTNTN